jgi:hypothetical protein
MPRCFSNLILAFAASLICLVLITSQSSNAAPTANRAPVALAANACPFCSAVALTFTQQIDQKDIAVVAKLIENPPPPSEDAEDFPDGKFEIVGILKGESLVKPGMTFMTQLVGVHTEGQKFLVMGQGTPDVAWTTPMKASERVFDYLQETQALPADGPQRLAFFQKYFEDKEKILAFDAYDEFAAAPYEDLIAIKDQMNREKLVEYIKSEKTTVNRRRLYFTMLGVCGTEEDASMLEGFIKSDSRKQQAGLDALVGCYLTLTGKAGLPLIQKTFLENQDTDYVDVSAVIDALRFHATDADVIPVSEIIPVVRILLDHSEYDDIIIEDLARWGDWSVLEKLVQKFKDAKEDANWKRVPIITYLRACPKPEAAKYIEELKKIDAKAVERADFFLGFGDSDDDWDEDDDGEPAQDDETAPQPTISIPAIDEPTGQRTSLLPIGPKANTVIDSRVKAALAEVASVVENVEVPAERIELAQAIDVQLPAIDEATRASFTSASSTIGKTTDNSPAGRSFIPTQVALVSSTATGINATIRSGAQYAGSASLLGKILLFPFAASILIFGLMWSVVNGWFERLIF